MPFMRTSLLYLLAGPLFLLVLVGEPNVGMATGLYTPGGFMALYLLYLVSFLVFDAYVSRYTPTVAQLALFTFAYYAVFITGFFHAEIADYTAHSGRELITTLIRVQASFFTVYAFVLLHRVFGRRSTGIRMRTSLLILSAYVLLMSLTGKLGIPAIIMTVTEAPLLSGVFMALGLMALVFATRRVESVSGRPPRGLVSLSLLFAALAIVPGITAYMALILAQIAASVILLSRRSFRLLPVARL